MFPSREMMDRNASQNIHGAIGEPVSGVALSPPRWIEPTDTLPPRCEVDGRIAPVDRAATARPSTFRVWLPANWNRRAVQQGGGGMNTAP